MKRSWAIIIFGVLILISVVIYAFSHRYYVSGNYVVDRFTGKTRHVLSALAETPTPTTTPSRTPWTAEDVRALRGETEKPKGDFSKVVISGHTLDTSNPYLYKVSCAVKNNDSISHTLKVKAIFYDKNKSPILTEESSSITVDPDDIESAEISVFFPVEGIDSYDLKLIEQ